MLPSLSVLPAEAKLRGKYELRGGVVGIGHGLIGVVVHGNDPVRKIEFEGGVSVPIVHGYELFARVIAEEDASAVRVIDRGGEIPLFVAVHGDISVRVGLLREVAVFVHLKCPFKIVELYTVFAFPTMKIFIAAVTAPLRAPCASRTGFAFFNCFPVNANSQTGRRFGVFSWNIGANDV